MYSFLYVREKCCTWGWLELIMNKECVANAGFSQNDLTWHQKHITLLEITTKICTYHEGLWGSDVDLWSLLLSHHHFKGIHLFSSNIVMFVTCPKMCLLLQDPQKNENNNTKENKRRKTSYEWACMESQ